jgi:hypothetical protein
MTAPDAIYQLVEKFHKDIYFYRSLTYSEDQATRELIGPFFSALGWRMTDRHYVIHDLTPAVVDGVQWRPKRPDYRFLVNGKTRFYVEAKAPYANIHEYPDIAYQVRRYGWSAGLPACVLTDFEELSVYDCLVRPKRGDDAKQDRLRYYTYEQYVDQWDEIAAMFSYDAVCANKLDGWVREHCEQVPEPMGEFLLAEIAGWKESLAADIADNNADLTPGKAEDAAGVIVDRLLFLRVCEDLNSEPYARLRDIQKPGAIYQALKPFFRQAGTKYRTDLFPSGDSTDPTLALQIGDEPLDAILTALYYPTSPYEFGVLPDDVLHQVYGRFLG